MNKTLIFVLFSIVISIYFQKYIIRYYYSNRGNYLDVYPRAKYLLIDKNDYNVEPRPNLLFQIYIKHDIKKIPKNVYENMEKFAPDYKHIIIDDKIAKQFLQTHFDPVVYETFTDIKKESIKGELLRYCLLYINGGVYLDICTKLIKPLSEIFIDKNTIYTSLNSSRSYMNNGLISTPSRHPIFLSLIYYIIKMGKPIYYHDFRIDFMRQIEIDVHHKVNFGANNSYTTEQKYYLLEEKCLKNSNMCRKPDRYGLCCIHYDGEIPVLKARRYGYPW